MKKRVLKKLGLHRETLLRLDGADLGRARGAGTLSVEPPCADSDCCPPPDTGCETASTLSCTQ
jgi:hypothetical protein